MDWRGLGWIGVGVGALAPRIPRILRFDKTGKLCRAEQNIILLEGGMDGKVGSVAGTDVRERVIS